MVGHEAIKSALKRLIKRERTADLQEHVQHLHGESDRAMIILEAAYLEDAILEELMRRMPSLNSAERARIFDVQGPAGTMSARIWLAQGLGIINRQRRRQFETIKEMRNAAAHAQGPVSFDVPEIRDGTLSLLDLEHQPEFQDASRAELRAVFITAIEVFRGEMVLFHKPRLHPKSIRLVFESERARDASAD